MLKKIIYVLIGIGILLYGYYLHAIMHFDESLVFLVLGGMVLGSIFDQSTTKKEIEVRFYSRVYRHYFSNDKKQIDDFDNMLTEKKIDLSLACQYFDIQKDKI